MEDTVLISTGYGKLHLYYAARAAQSTGYLNSMITSYYLKRKWVPFVERLAEAKVPIFRRMLNYRDPDIAEDRVISLISSEIFGRLSHLATARGCSDRLQYFLDRAASTLYGKCASRHVRSPVKVVHSRSGFSRCIIPAAHRIGARVLLEQSAAHPDFTRQILAEEYEKWGVPLVRRTYVRPVQEMRHDISEADFVLTNSEFCASTIRPYISDPARIRIVYTGVDVERFAPRKEEKCSKFRILFVGNLSTFKGVVYAIRAFKLLGLHDAELILVGSRSVDCPQAVFDSADCYRYVPSVPHQDMPFHYAQADIFVYPSLAEGSAKVVGEAMASGLPCIVTPNSGSVVRDGVDGFVVPARDESALAERILRLYKDRDLCREMGQSARQRAIDTITWRHYETNLLKVYEEIAMM